MSASYAELEGLRQCMSHYTMFSDSMVAEMRLAIRKLALRIVANAQRRLKQHGSIASGALRQSGSVRPQPDGTIDAGFSEAYAYFVEYGRKAGKFPPTKDIEEWFWKKKSVMGGIRTKEDAKRAAFLIARKIAKEGTTPRPFLIPAMQEEKTKCDNYWRNAFRKAENAIR